MRERALVLAIGALCVLLEPRSLPGQEAPDWVATYTGPSREGDIPYAIAVDEQGRVWVSGASNLGIVPPGQPEDACSDDDVCRDWITVLYSPEGQELWKMPYNGPDQSSDCAFALAVDAEGSSYVAGLASRAEGGNTLTTVKYSVEGAELWVRVVTIPGRSFGRAWAVVVDGGTVYVLGQTSARPDDPG